jgi:hypothetical protein
MISAAYAARVCALLVAGSTYELVIGALPYEVPGVVAGLMLGVAVTGCPSPGVRFNEQPKRATVRIIEIGKALRIVWPPVLSQV